MVHFAPILAVSPLLFTLAQGACDGHKGSNRRHHAKNAAAASAAASTSAVAASTTNPSTSNALPTINNLAANPNTKSSSTAAAASSSAGSSSWVASSSAGASSWSSAGAKGSASSAGSASSTTSSSKAASTTAASSSSSGTLGAQLAGGFTLNSIAVGMLPDDGSGGGTAQTMAQLNSAMGGTFKAQGWYAQISSADTFDGSQLTARMSEIVAAGGVFQPAVMPTYGWTGLTSDNNYQAVAVCKVMQQFVDQGLEVWLRFAHEVNWYQQDGTYKGTAADFKEGWATVAAACKQYAPTVKMWFTPNVADLSTYESYYPDDPSTVDIIGIDLYPSNPTSSTFVTEMQPFHDKYCSESGPKFAIGEMGLDASYTIATRLAYLQSATSASTKSAMPYLIAASWFNYYKGYDFRVAGLSGDTVTKAYLASA